MTEQAHGSLDQPPREPAAAEGHAPGPYEAVPGPYEAVPGDEEQATYDPADYSADDLAAIEDAGPGADLDFPALPGGAPLEIDYDPPDENLPDEQEYADEDADLYVTVAFNTTIGTVNGTM